MDNYRVPGQLLRASIKLSAVRMVCRAVLLMLTHDNAELEASLGCLDFGSGSLGLLWHGADVLTRAA